MFRKSAQHKTKTPCDKGSAKSSLALIIFFKISDFPEIVPSTLTQFALLFHFGQHEKIRYSVFIHETFTVTVLNLRICVYRISAEVFLWKIKKVTSNHNIQSNGYCVHVD